jgi:hypothetical protein
VSLIARLHAGSVLDAVTHEETIRVKMGTMAAGRR